MNRSGQSSFEFLLLLAIAFTFMLIIGGVFFAVSSTSQEQLSSKQISKIGNELMSTAERVYYRGPGNQIRYQASFPNNILNMTIEYVYVNETLNYSMLTITQDETARNEDETVQRENFFFPREIEILLACGDKCEIIGGEPNFGQENFTYVFVNGTTNQGSKTFSLRAEDGIVEITHER